MKCLIALMSAHEVMYEDPKCPRRKYWNLMSQKLQNNDHTMSTTQCENKWHHLLSSHSKFSKNRNETGRKRKTFHYFDEMEEFVEKRHDINPPFVDGSGVSNVKEIEGTPGMSSIHDSKLSDEKRKHFKAKSEMAKRKYTQTKVGTSALIEFFSEMEKKE